MKKIWITMILTMIVLSLYSQVSRKKYIESENLIEWPIGFNPKEADFYVHNQIEINASPEVVWDLLINVGDWNSWYNGIQNIKFEGQEEQILRLGSKVFWNSMGQSLNNTIIQYGPNKALTWQFNESKIQGCHAWIILPTDNGCLVITDESQTGHLAKLQKLFLPNKLKKQHNDWLRLLKQQAEGKNDLSSE
jgi:hypothetical protein